MKSFLCSQLSLKHILSFVFIFCYSLFALYSIQSHSVNGSHNFKWLSLFDFYCIRCLLFFSPIQLYFLHLNGLCMFVHFMQCARVIVWTSFKSMSHFFFSCFYKMIFVYSFFFLLCFVYRVHDTFSFSKNVMDIADRYTLVKMATNDEPHFHFFFFSIFSVYDAMNAFFLNPSPQCHLDS